MNRNSNTYQILYSAIMVILVGAAGAGMRPCYLLVDCYTGGG